jgi:hypothetical protein
MEMLMPANQPLDVPTEAQRLGFSIVETRLGGETVWAWSRGSDVEWPHFATQGEAFAWMEDQIRSTTLADS